MAEGKPTFNILADTPKSLFQTFETISDFIVIHIKNIRIIDVSFTTEKIGSGKQQTSVTGEELQDGGRVRCGDHLPPHKYIRNTFTCGTTPTEHLLNAGRRPQTSQKARNSPRTWVG